jgi:DNA-binding protein HU-beta
MTKKEFINAMADAYEGEISKSDLKETFDILIDGIIDVVAGGDEVNITGFGKFYPVVRKARKGRNPATGESVNIPEKTIVKFKVGKTFKDAVSDS